MNFIALLWSFVASAIAAVLAVTIGIASLTGVDPDRPSTGPGAGQYGD